MGKTDSPGRAPGTHREEVADTTFEAIVFDWDGTAVPDRSADAASVREAVEALCSRGVHVFVVSGTHVDHVDGQLRARPEGRGRLHLCLNRGSEVYDVGAEGPVLAYRRSASREEDTSLDRAAERTVDVLAARGLEARIVSQRLNRRKIDLIPLDEWSDPPKARIGELAEAVSGRLGSYGIHSLAEVVSLAEDVSRRTGLANPRVTSDVKHVEIGLTDKSDSARFAARWLSVRGITGALVLIAGDEFGEIGGVRGSDSLMLVEELNRAVAVSVGVEPFGVPSGIIHLPGGPPTFLGLLGTQLQRRSDKRVPGVDPDPEWVLVLPTKHSSERVSEALATLSNGWAGTRAAYEDLDPASTPLFTLSGSYASESGLLAGPIWTSIGPSQVTRRRAGHRRVLDLRSGTLHRFPVRRGGLRTIHFVSEASTHAMALRAEGPADVLDAGETLRRPPGAENFEVSERNQDRLARTAGASGAEIVTAAHDETIDTKELRTLERLCTWSARRAGAGFDEAIDRLAETRTAGFDALLADHREAWARLWADAEVVIEGSADDQMTARFCVFHLLSAVHDHPGELALGARGLSGPAYGGHVFWDTDVFVLPVLAAIRPSAARALLEYRIRRLPAARGAAEANGFHGARFPWESAADGVDVTPRSARGKHGELVAIRTGQLEEHITADVAWSAAQFVTWSGDKAFLAGPGRGLVVDTARYWASRIRVDDRVSEGHIYGVIGPDEYHAPVDDNVFTNVMARWNLRQGARMLEDEGAFEEAARLRAAAESLVDGWHSELGVYEQFAGYFRLEPLLVADIATPPVAIDVLLGPRRTTGSQLIKQADVLLAHHLLPNDVVKGSLRSNLAFYGPRTAHGSSLSPAIHASLLARAGEPERALELFRVGARIDLDDITGTTAGGLHLAAMGGSWQALAFGFLGIRGESGILEVDPCLPGSWEALGLRIRFLGSPLRVRADHHSVLVECEAPVVVQVGGNEPRRCEPPGATFEIETRNNYQPLAVRDP